MVVIRLARGGTKKRPFYRVVVSNSREARDGRYIEKLGFYNQIATGEEIKIQLNQDRIDYWLSKGAQPSDRVKYLVDNFAEIAAGTLKKKPKPKKVKEAKKVEVPAEASEVKEEAPKAEEKPVEEKPAEEPKPEEKPAEEPKVEEKEPEEKPAEEPKKEGPAPEPEKPEAEEPKLEEKPTESKPEEKSE